MSPAAQRTNTEAQRLVEFLFSQAAHYRKHAPDLTTDIKGFQDSAALLDTYRAGLELVDPHPTMRAELIRWTPVDDTPPADLEEVLLWYAGDASPLIGWLDGHLWYSADGRVMHFQSVTHWARLPKGPAADTPTRQAPAEVIL